MQEDCPVCCWRAGKKSGYLTILYKWPDNLEDGALLCWLWHTEPPIFIYTYIFFCRVEMYLKIKQKKQETGFVFSIQKLCASCRSLDLCQRTLLTDNAQSQRLFFPPFHSGLLFYVIEKFYLWLWLLFFVFSLIFRFGKEKDWKRRKKVSIPFFLSSLFIYIFLVVLITSTLIQFACCFIQHSHTHTHLSCLFPPSWRTGFFRSRFPENFLSLWNHKMR